MNRLTWGLIDRYRCPEAFLPLRMRDSIGEDSGFFQFGPGITCYGRSSAGYRRSRVEPVLYDVAGDVVFHDSQVYLPFDPTEVIENLRLERYAAAHDSTFRRFAKHAYYRLRPILHRSVRKEIQKLQLNGWGGARLPFPAWPVDRTVENICERLLLLALQATGACRIPFIWFWPERASSCAVMTHDVESQVGRDACTELMDIDDRFGIKASFQIVPERRYSVSRQFLASIRDRGFEIVIQDLNHDGRLFDERNEFLRRAALINEYARVYGAKGFRAAVLYRRPDWYQAFDFSFDMSIPNTAHLDPQRGGCCTIMPYFIENILELPVTTTQDYMLFHLLEERSTDLWKRQVELITEKNGLVSFIVHPDYLISHEVKSIYKDLLLHLREVQAQRRIWVTLPSEVDRWWRTRSKMQLVPRGDEWRIEGDGAERAVVAYARNADGKLVYEIEPERPSMAHSPLN
jgi:hypothetical protein